ncbi:MULTISPECIES: ABC transporter ATP-binding protein [Lactobacillus]|uniref:ABC transporter ATP-binding protein n=1 Tax=Lactobacillus xujianguonis TaxID=2495899 RepID=A0A437SVC7_9LACO|nr:MULTISPECIES: ABC transporter ATP-binding protein [Lactobacillus]RVU70886.1 ABC transporter ATP-binding protein [Lactobacillus xujianguonis]RVU73767.1 ABC transporter ATP-binding protein [Lactobacillus xujianguonis]
MLEVKQLNKSFGTQQVLFDVNLTAHPGRILGLIGKNGSGKTTLFHSILKFVSYTGEITIAGHPFNEQDYNQIGYLPEERSLMPKETIQQQVQFLASLKGMSPKAINAALPDWMDRLGVKGVLSDKIKSLSKGNQQKVQMIATLIHQPKLIILDEPFSGLDPVNVEIMKSVILQQKWQGATIIFSDHDMRNVEELCDDVVMINDGRIVLNGPVNDIRQEFGLTRLYVRVDKSADDLAQLPGVTEVSQLNDGKFKLILSDAKFGRAIFEQLSQGQYLQTFDQEPPTLNEIFKMKAGASHE